MAFPEFSISESYTAGEYIWVDDTLYRFVQDHSAGKWTGQDVQKISGKQLANMLYEKHQYAEAQKELLDTKGGWIVATDTGSIVTPITAEAQTPSTLTVSIEPVQSGSGDPSPDNVRAITGHTQAKVYRVGNILADSDDLTNYGYYNDSGTLTYGTSTKYTADYIAVEPSTTYTLSFDLRNNNSTVPKLRLHEYNASKTWLRQSISQTPSEPYGINTVSYTSSADAYYVRFCLDIDAENVLLGTGTSVTIDLDGTRYGGTLDVLTGEMTVTHGIVTYDGSTQSGVTYTMDGTALNIQDSNYVPSTSGYVTGCLCNRFKIVETDSAWSSLTVGMRIYHHSSWAYTRFYIKGVDDITDVDSGKTWLGSNPVDIYYPLATPLTVTLDPHTLQLLAGENVVWASTGDVSVTYRADTKAYIDKLFTALQALALEN